MMSTLPGASLPGASLPNLQMTSVIPTAASAMVGGAGGSFPPTAGAVSM